MAADWAALCALLTLASARVTVTDDAIVLTTNTSTLELSTINGDVTSITHGNQTLSYVVPNSVLVFSFQLCSNEAVQSACTRYFNANFTSMQTTTVGECVVMKYSNMTVPSHAILVKTVACSRSSDNKVARHG